jgi:hypothetical protein
MPYALVFAGLVLIITGINNTYVQLGSQLKSDFTGDKNFIMYAAALGGVGALGYINALRTFSHYFMALILISLVLSNKGFFQNLTAALSAQPIAPTAGSDAQTSISPTASTATINSAITSNQSGAFGQSPASEGQAKFNGWVNWFLGRSTNSGN